jgi:hypothetical protein
MATTYTYKIHPIAEIFPEMTEEEFEALVKDIEQNGCLEPIHLFKGKIIDGRSRYLACKKLKEEVPTKQYRGTESGLPSFVISLNLARRHLSTSQRAMVAAKLVEYSQGAPPGNTNAQRGKNAPLSEDWTSEAAKSIPDELPDGMNERGGTTVEKASGRLRVSPRSTKQANAVLKKGSAKVIRKVETGEVPVSRAAKVVDLPKKDQEKALATKLRKPPKTLSPEIISAWMEGYNEGRLGHEPKYKLVEDEENKKMMYMGIGSDGKEFYAPVMKVIQ